MFKNRLIQKLTPAEQETISSITELTNGWLLEFHSARVHMHHLQVSLTRDEACIEFDKSKVTVQLRMYKQPEQRENKFIDQVIATIQTVIDRSNVEEKVFSLIGLPGVKMYVSNRRKK